MQIGLVSFKFRQLAFGSFFNSTKAGSLFLGEGEGEGERKRES